MIGHCLPYSLRTFLVALGMCLILPDPANSVEPAPKSKGWIFACTAANDLYRVTKANGTSCPRFPTAAEAVRSAPEGSAVLILADNYPEQTTTVGKAVFDEAAHKHLRLYVEYPDRLPDMDIDHPKDVKFERAVVASTFFGETLRPMRIVLVSSCRYLPVRAKEVHLVMARVAGVDTAVFGLKDTPADPILFDHPRGNLLVATTKLSHFVTGRYLPAEAWRTIWQTILHRLQPD